MQDTNASGSALVSNGYNLAATSANAFYFELTSPANGTAVNVTTAAVTLGNTADVQACSNSMLP